jgi:uncharacterized membrane protein YhiD involved in acid resistance
MVNAYLFNAFMITMFVVLALLVIRTIVKFVSILIIRRDNKREHLRFERQVRDDQISDIYRRLREKDEEMWKLRNNVDELSSTISKKGEIKNVKKKKRN